MIDAIELKNFKAFSAPVRIEFAPITLLFGANSVGKSAIISALDFVHRAVGGESTSAIKNVAHHGTKDDTVVRVDFEQHWAWAESDPTSWDRILALDLDYLAYLPGTVTVVNFGSESRQEWQARHPPEPSILGPLHSIPPTTRLEGGFLGQNIARLTHGELSVHPKALYELCDELARQHLRDSEVLREVAVWARALPKEDEWFSVGRFRGDDGYFGEVDFEGDSPDGLFPFLLAPFVVARCCLEAHIHVGPLRRRVGGGDVFENQLSQDWYDGSAAWERLHGIENSVEEVNRWLLAEDRLNMAHSIERRQEYLLSVSVAERVQDLSDKELRHLLEDASHPRRSTFGVRDHRTGVVVGPTDVGTGISQVVPIIVASRWNSGTIIVEQPELHIHPAVQSAIGDLFISSLEREDKLGSERNQVIVETHSEHLMLRLMRRIRETSRDTLENEEFRLTPEEVGIYYIENREGVVEASRLAVDRDGDFRGGWPADFFAERARELF